MSWLNFVSINTKHRKELFHFSPGYISLQQMNMIYRCKFVVERLQPIKNTKKDHKILVSRYRI